MLIRRLSEWPLGPSFAALALLGYSALVVWGAPEGPRTLQGVLIDKECSPKAETRMVADPSPHLEGGMLWAYTHTRKCLLMPACQRSGYGVFAYDVTKFLAFDAAGNQKALALIGSTQKQDDMRVEVTGEVKGDTIKLTSLELLP